MSRFDAEHAARADEAAARDARELVVGATVYRVAYGQIQEGVVRRVGRCKDPSSGEDPTGPRPYYAAEFRRAPGGHGDWETQSISWKFFANRSRAVARLVKLLETEALFLERNLARVRQRIVDIQSGKETP